MGLNFVQRLITKDDGRFEFGIIDQQPVFAVMAPGFARQIRFFDAAEIATLHQSELKIELIPESSISGLVKLNGAPVPNAELRLADTSNWELDFEQIKADANGHFTIHQLSAGTYHLSVYQSSGQVSTSRLTKKIVLQANEAMKNVELDSPGGSSLLRGKVNPFAMVVLTPTKLDGDIAIDYSTIGGVASPEGNFVICGLHPGKYNVQIISASSMRGYHAWGTHANVVVNGETDLAIDESVAFPFRP